MTQNIHLNDKLPSNCKYLTPKAKFLGNEIPKFPHLSMHGDKCHNVLLYQHPQKSKI